MIKSRTIQLDFTSNYSSRKQNDLQIWKRTYGESSELLDKECTAQLPALSEFKSTWINPKVKIKTWECDKGNGVNELWEVKKSRKEPDWQWENVAAIIKMQEWVKMKRWF